MWGRIRSRRSREHRTFRGTRVAAVVVLVGAVSTLLGACVERTRYEGPPGLELQLERSSVELRQGASILLHLELERDERLSGAVELRVRGLPLGLGGAPVRVLPGETTAQLELRADGAPTGLELPFIVEARVDDVVATAAGSVFVAGPSGSADGSLQLLRPSAGMELLPLRQPQGGLLFAVPASAELRRFQLDAAPDLSFGEAGVMSLRAALGDLVLTSVLAAAQSSGATVLAMTYDDPAAATAAGVPDGVALLRVLPEGVLDERYGVSPAHPRTLIARDGLRLRGLGAGRDDQLVLWAEDGAGQSTLLLVAPDGALLHEQAIEPGLLSRRELLLLDDGRVIGVGPQGLVRFLPDLTRDASFGVDGVRRLGDRPPQLSLTTNGFMAAGAVLKAELPVPALWRFDADGKYLIGFSGEGQRFPLPLLGTGALANASEMQGGVLALGSYASRAVLFRMQDDGAIDLELGADQSTPGRRELTVMIGGDTLWELVPSTRWRALVVVRSPFQGAYLVFRIWQ